MNGRILLVARNQDVTESIAAVLNAEDYETTVAATGAAALQCLSSDWFDVIIAEIGTEGVPDDELFGKARELDPPAEVILLTGRYGPEHAAATAGPGESFSYLRKPLESIEDLIISVGKAVAKRRLQQRNRQLLDQLGQHQQQVQNLRQELDETSRSYLRLFNEAPIGCLTLDDNNCIVEINRAARDLLNLSEQDRTNIAFTDFVAPEWQKSFADHLVRVRRQNNNCSCELRIIARGGVCVDVHAQSIAPFAVNGGGDPLRIALLDVSEQKRAERNLRESENRFRNLFKTMQQGVVFQDGQGRITILNPAAERILGRSSEQLLGRDCNALCYRARDQWGESMAVAQHPSRIALRTGETVRNAVMGVFNPTAQETRWLRVHAVPCFNEGESRPSRIFTSFDDVTQLMRIEDALRESEDRHRNLMETILQGVEEMDIEGTILYANPALCRMHGYQPGSLTGRSILDFCCTDESRKELKQHLQYLVREQVPPTPYESKDRCAGGSEIDVRLDWNYKRNSRGDVTGFIAVISDVTASKQARKALLESERRYRELVEQAAEGICVVSRDCAFLAVNPRLCAILGYERQELLNIPVRKILDEPQWPNQLPDLQQLETGAWFAGECKAYRKSGEPFYAAFSAKVLEDRSVQAIVRDVTERKTAEQQLLESKNRFKETVDLVPNIICEIDRDLIITYANQLGLETFGYTVDDLPAGVHVLDLIHPNDRALVQRNFTRIADGEELVPTEIRLLKRDGSWIHALVNAAAISGHGGFTGFRISLMDITDFKKLSKQLQDAKSFEAIATLAGGIAHQFNNALAVIKGSTELLQLDTPGIDDQHRLIGHIETATERLTGLTAQLLAYARGGRYQPETVNAVEMVGQGLELLGHAMDPDIRLNFERVPGDIAIEVDLTQMQMVLSAVLENASEAVAGAGTITVVVDPKPYTVSRSRPGGHPEGSYVHILIEDTGQGMSDQEKERIFDPFFTTKFQGRGLGMAAAYGIVRNHQGWMEVESEPGKGTRIHIFLPMAYPQPGPEGRSVPEIEPLKKVQTVFVIDDEPTLLTITREMLETLGYRVLTAGSGRDSLQLAEQYAGAIDLVLLDLILMDLSAKSVCQGLLELYPDVKIIVCSGYSLDQPAKELLAMGAFAFLQKPFSLTDLQDLLEQALAG